jgi:hypothetical protein
MLGPILETTCSRPGPASVRSARGWRLHTRGLAQTVARDHCRRERSPNGVAWRIPDWTAVGLRVERARLAEFSAHVSRPRVIMRSIPSDRSDHSFPDPVPRIERLSPSAAACPTFGPRIRLAVTGRLGRPGSGASRIGGLSPRGSSAPRAATLTRIVSSAAFACQ